jgi:uncharacterized protein (DUF433 family)
MLDYTEYIELDQTKRFGKPVLKNSRISVCDVLSWFAGGMSEQEILDDFPELSIEQIRS